MSSLIELVEQVNRGADADAESLLPYQQSANSAERFLAFHAGATLGLRKSHADLSEALRAIGYADRKVLEQYVGLCAFLGRSDEAVGPTVAFGRTAVERGELSLGLEAASSAVAQDLGRGGEWSRDRANLIALGELYQTAADAAGWAGGPGIAWSNTQPHVGYLVSALGDDEPAARGSATLAAHLDKNAFRLKVYATEGFVRRDGQQWAGWPSAGVAGRIGKRPGGAAGGTWINNGVGAIPSAARGEAVVSRLRDAGAGHWVAPTNGDVLSAATALSDRLVADQTDVLIVDADVTDPVAGLVVSWGVARRVLWVSRRRPLYSKKIDAVCYLDPAAAEADGEWWRKSDVEPTVLVEGLDAAAGEAEGPMPSRRQYGIPDSAVICATAADDVSRRVGEGMIDGVIALLRKQPQAVYLLIGAGETAGLRRRFEAAGVGRRVGYAGRRRDLAAFLRMADVYLCPFGGSDATPASPAETIAAMGAGLPVLAADDASGVAGPAGEEAVAADAEAWADRAARLARDGGLRRKGGASMRRRAEQSFAYAATAREVEAIVSRLAQDGQTISDPAPAAKKAA